MSMELNFQTAGETADALVENTRVEVAHEGQHDQHLIVKGDITHAGTLAALRRAGWYVSGVHGRTTFFHRN